MKGLSTVHFSSGQVVYREGDLSDSLYFMLGPTAEPEADGHADEGSELTTETREKEGREGDEDGDGDEPQRVFPFVPTKRFFGEEGLVYRWVWANEHFAARAGGHRSRAGVVPSVG